MNIFASKKVRKILLSVVIASIIAGGAFFTLGTHITHAFTHAQGDPAIRAVLGLLGGPENIASKLSAGFGTALLATTGSVLWLAGILLNKVVDIVVIGMGSFIESIGTIDIAWSVIRDFANMVFIFILLYISIATILRIQRYEARQLLVKVVIAALLVNFSLFFTKAIIDASNVLTAGFYNGIIGISGEQVVVTGTTGDDEPRLKGSSIGGLSGAFMSPLKLTTIYKTTPGPEGLPVEEVLESRNILTISLMGSLFILITAFIFFAGAILLTVRFVVLMTLMVLSPLAFVSIILPTTKQYWDKWLNTLLSQSFFAPLYMALMFVVAVIVNNEGYRSVVFQTGSPSSFSGAFTGATDEIIVILNFAIVSGLMIAALIVSKSLGASGSKLATNLAGKATFGVAGFAGRQTIGRAGQALARSGFANRLAQRGGVGGVVGKGLVGAGEQFSKGSFDLRAALNTVGADVGKPGGKGGFKKERETAIKRRVGYGERAAEAEGRATAERQRRATQEEAEKRFVEQRTRDIRARLTKAQQKEQETGLKGDRIRAETELILAEDAARREFRGSDLQRLLRRAPSQGTPEQQLQRAARALTFEQTRTAKTVQEARQKLNDLKKKGAKESEIKKAQADLTAAETKLTEEINEQVATGKNRRKVETSINNYINALDDVAASGKRVGAAIGQAKQFYGERYAAATSFGIPSEIKREAAKKLRQTKGPKDKLLDTIKGAVESGELSGSDLGVESAAEGGGDEGGGGEQTGSPAEGGGNE